MAVSNKDLHGAFTQLLCAACRCSTEPATSSKARPQSQLQQWPLIFSDDEPIRRSLKPTCGNLGDMCVLIPPLPRETSGGLLALHVAWNFQIPLPWARIEYGFERSDGQFFCFRFEMPSGPAGHAYPHAQYSQIFVWRPAGKYLASSKKSGMPVNVSYPAFPMYIFNPVELLVSSFIAVYDKKIERNLWDAMTQKRVNICLNECVRYVVQCIEPT